MALEVMISVKTAGPNLAQRKFSGAIPQEPLVNSEQIKNMDRAVNPYQGLMMVNGVSKVS